jgi:hypothetical protein
MQASYTLHYIKCQLFTVVHIQVKYSIIISEMNIDQLFHSVRYLWLVVDRIKIQLTNVITVTDSYCMWS